MTVRVKICGITSVEDARQAALAGADAIGLVFYPKSPRCVTAQHAAEICAAVGPYVTVVGLFVNAPAEQVQDILASVPLHVLQFHGDENSEYCQQFSRPWYKAIRMSAELDPMVEVERFSAATALLFDAWHKDKYGGTGLTFDWQRVPAKSCCAVLAGGLTPDNIAQAVAAVNPYGVDVSGGVELSPGKKCPNKTKLFIQRAKSLETLS